MIQLPAYSWFVTIDGGRPATNTYTGSCGTAPALGCISVPTFHYKVSIKNVGTETAHILCECFSEKPWSEGGGKEPIGCKEFACSPDGLAQAAAWLNQTRGESVTTERQKGSL